MKSLSFSEAVKGTLQYAMHKNDKVMLLGEGIDDPKGIDGTVLGLYKEFGAERVIDLPLAENGCMGVAIGLAMDGMLPVIVHQRMDFLLMAMDQIINHAAKWHYMFGGRQSIPLVIKCTVGQGWGMGPTHSQSLQALFAHIPGIKVVMPSNPYDAKGLLMSSIKDPNPVIFIENYKCYASSSLVPDEPYCIPLGDANIVRVGEDLTIVTYGYLVREALKASELALKKGINIEVIDLRSICPIDKDLIIKSVSKTGRLIVADPGHRSYGVSAEVCSLVVESISNKLLSNVVRVGFPDAPTPASSVLEQYYYPSSDTIYEAIANIFSLSFKDTCNEAIL